jgi:phosphoribosylanthranilate isomerase
MQHRTRIKICGLTREEDVVDAVAAGADAIGFVLYERSPRHVSVDRAAQLAALLPPFVTPVLLFVNAPREVVAGSLAAMPSALPQFHGDESVADCRACGRPFLRAARMAPGFPLLDFAASQVGAAGLVLDAFVDGYGGGGKTFDWSLIPSDVPLPVVLSGGLNAANVAEAVARVRPWAVDVSSGVERSPGLKDAAAIRRFCAAVRRADHSADQSADKQPPRSISN